MIEFDILARARHNSDLFFNSLQVILCKLYHGNLMQRLKGFGPEITKIALDKQLHSS